jgi:hypothetical protein
MTSPEKQLNPKKKYWEECETDLKGNDAGEACYKGTILTIGNTTFTAKSLKNYYIS